MTWNELREMCDAVPETQRNQQVPIFVYCNGNIEFLNEGNFLSSNPDVESHCEDFNRGDFPEYTPYLLCGYGYPAD